jgi:hypothetical protein
MSAQLKARHNIDRLFRVIAQALGKLSDEELDQILEGKGKLEFVGVQQSRPKKGGASAAAGDEALNDLKARLQASTSRDEAIHLLENPPIRLKKPDLVRLAKLLNVHVASRDTVDTIKEKIIKKVATGADNLFEEVELR